MPPNHRVAVVYNEHKTTLALLNPTQLQSQVSDPELLKAMVELFGASHKCPSGYEVKVSPIVPNASAIEMSTLTVRAMILKGGFFRLRCALRDNRSR